MTVLMDTICPYCGTKFDAQTGVSDPELVPKSGDVTMCIECGQFSEFSDEGLIELPETTIDDLDLIVVQLARNIRKTFLERRSDAG